MPDDLSTDGLLAGLAQSPDWADLAPVAGQVGRWVLRMGTDDAEGDATLAALTGVAAMDGAFPVDLFMSHVHEDDRAVVSAAIGNAASGGAYEAVFRFRRPDGRVVWLEGSGRVVRLDGQSMLVGVNYDVTDLREAQARAELVAGEMAHRIKNIFALVQSIFSMAARNAESVEALSDAFSGRLRTLASLNALTLGDRAADVAMKDLVHAAAGVPVDAGRVAVEIPDPCDLSGAAAQTMVLLLGELTTNALKHGALKGDGGSVALKVAVEDGRFRFRWQEETPHPVAPPTREGFGMKVLTAMTASTHSGAPKLEWREDGLTFTCEWPVEGFMAA